jgi:hypothetical protein
MPEALSELNSESNEKKLIRILVHFQRKKTAYIQKYINKIYVKFNCASDEKKITFYFCKFIELYLIKG